MTTGCVNPIELIEHTISPVEYEPSVEDRLNKVLFRLEQNEPLLLHKLKEGNNFCTLGLLYEESGLGEWRENDYGEIYYSADLYSVLLYYGIKYNIRLNKLPEDLQRVILDSGRGFTKWDLVSIDFLNDNLIKNNWPDANLILIDLLKSLRFPK